VRNRAWDLVIGHAKGDIWGRTLAVGDEGSRSGFKADGAGPMVVATVVGIVKGVEVPTTVVDFGEKLIEGGGSGQGSTPSRIPSSTTPKAMRRPAARLRATPPKIRMTKPRKKQARAESSSQIWKRFMALGSPVRQVNKQRYTAKVTYTLKVGFKAHHLMIPRRRSKAWA
jgi:hypothetical protein